MYTRTFLFAGVFLLHWSFTFGQIYYFDNYSVSEGLAQSKVFSIIQDRHDYIWLGTAGGVSRFDGVSFKNFTSEDGLAINGVRALYEDRRGFLWFGHTEGGITRYTGRHFEIWNETDTLINSDITSIRGDSAGNVWITTAGNGVFRILNPGAASVSEFRFEQFRGGQLSDRVFDLFVSGDGTLNFVTDIGVQRRRKGSEGFEKFFIQGMGYFQVTSFIEDRKGNAWFGTYNDGLYKYDKDSGELEFFSTRNGLAHNFVSTLFEDRGGNIWAGTWGGGLTRIRESEIMTFNRDNGLQDLKIWAVLEDVEGNILVGTNESGLSIFKGEQFVSFTERNGLVNDQVWAILEDRNGRFWFGTNGGISIYHPVAETGHQFSGLRSSKYAVGNQIRFLEEDRSGHIWIGTYGNGTYEYDPATGGFDYSYRINSYNQQRIVTAMEIDRDNKLWVGTTDGLIYYDIGQQDVQYLTQVNGLAGTDISALYADSENSLWIGSRGKGITVIEGDSVKPLDLGLNFTPNCFTRSSDGRIWTGTESQGILVIAGDSIRQHLRMRDGLLANLVSLVEVDDEDNVYIGTNKGLNVYKAAEGRIYAYMEKNGFVGIETKHNASCRDSEGNLWFGTVGGVVKYNHLYEPRPAMEPLTHITRMRVNLEEREMGEGLKLGFTENSIIFDYTSICLTNPDAVLYQYKLEGADLDWLPRTDQTVATYPALQPGKYTFKVKARNSNGDWNREPVAFAFQIKPPFYATWWFILACSILGALGIFAYITLRTRKLRRENIILEEKVRLRTAQVVAQKEELAQKNKDITDSITYARRIQFAILPPEVSFENTFILFKPKDIVSGDFYWLLEKEGRQFIAAVDCTGHGVPGAFMSIIGHNMLNKVVKEYNILTPAEILKHLDAEVTKTLHQQSESITVLDGMDMTLVAYRKDKNLLEFSGAINPMYLVRDGELIETKGDRLPIGRSELKKHKEFTNHEIDIRPGDTMYLFSDGYADQFGGKKGKKFKIARMKELILQMQDKSIEEQRTCLDTAIERWRGEYDQVDDILVIGRRF